MESLIAEVEPKLNEQLADLGSKIRQAESNILTLKEGYLKVQGAIELLDVLKKEIEKVNAMKVIEEAL